MAFMAANGIDILKYDRRPLAVVMSDEIPYEKWNRQLKMIKRAGYEGWHDFLRSRA